MPSSLVGATAELGVVADGASLSAYAAGVGRSDPEYFDTERPGGLVAHPLWPVSPEWALLTSHRFLFGSALERSELLRAVHAGHDLAWHAPVRAGEALRIVGRIDGIETTRAGARVVHRFDAHADIADRDEPRWTSWMTTVYRGVEVRGADCPAPERSAPRAHLPSTPIGRVTVPVAAVAAHVYTACARIANPIHTDPAVAHAAGLPGPILHGTATLALGVGAVLDAVGAAPVARRVTGAFRAMTAVPSTLTIEIGAATVDGDIPFTVRNEHGAPAVADGWVTPGLPPS